MAFSKCPMSLFLTSDYPTMTDIFSCKASVRFLGLLACPVIVLTGRDRSTHEKRCYDAGAKLFFQKPVDNRALLLAIEQLVG